MIAIKIKIVEVENINGADVANFEVIDVETDENVSDVDIQRLLWNWRDDCQLKEFCINPTTMCFTGRLMLSESKAPNPGDCLALRLPGEDEIRP